MKNHPLKTITLLLVIIQIQIANGQIDPAYEIGTWKNFTNAAVSYTWDDNTAKQLTVAKPIFDNYGFKTTFFITTNWGPNWAAFQTASTDGHEVASHSKSHPNFGNLDETQRLEELEGSKNAINANISGNQCLTFAYPYCVVGDNAQTESLYISARTCQGAIESSTPANIMSVSSIVCGTAGSVMTSEHFTNKVNEATSSNGWVVFLLHGIDNDGGFSPIASTDLDTHLNYMNQNQDTFWVATYGDAVKYIKERDNSSIVETSNDNNEIVFQLTNNLDTNIYNIPLSLKRAIPMDWSVTSVTQDGNPIDYQVLEESSEKFIQLDALPNGGDVIITGEESLGVDEFSHSLSNLSLFPNPSKGDMVTLKFLLKRKGGMSISIINQTGALLQDIAKKEYLRGEHQLQLDVSRWKGQPIYLVMSIDGVLMTKKLINP